MQNDRPITITTAGDHTSKNWLPQKLMWGEFVAKLGTPARSTETQAQYLALPKAQQDALKDVGGYVGGTLSGPRRIARAVTGRDLVTLDFDSIPQHGTQDILRKVDGFGCGFAVYSTRKHSPLTPRLRIIFPLNRTVTPDEYEPIARRMAEWVGIAFADPSTFEASRLMYWPSVCSDAEYVYTFADRPFIDADATLGTYADWHNVAEWPVVPGTAQAVLREVDKQADPEAKRGIVGAFCRTYDVPAAIAAYIPHAYDQIDDNRYTYTGGSTVGGAVLYDNGKFLFSHHATDPCSGKLVNAFDLVRLHLYGDQDADVKPGTPTNRMPSFVNMRQRALADQRVRGLLDTEQYAEIMEDFGSTPDTPAGNSPVEDGAWLQKLERSSDTGKPTKTTDNALIILENDPRLKGRLIYDEFSNRALALGPLPWNADPKRRDWDDLDDSGLRHYLEHVYGINGKDRIYDALALAGHHNSINDVTDYLKGLVWDGKPRVETLLTTYLGALDTPYIRAVTRKTLVAAVARAFVPGVKFDNMLVLTGKQGIGKSTLFRKLGREWFNDSIKTFEGKDVCEQIQGTWIAEIPELEAYNRSTLNLVKQFLSQVDDIFRPAYGRRAEKFPRRCIFVGTTNGAEFLRDKTGNRRFWPVDVLQQPPEKNVLRDLAEDEVGQIWAEAVLMWRMGETLYLSKGQEDEALEAQDEHREVSAKEGLIADFLEKLVPVDWVKWDADKRAMFWADSLHGDVECVPRDRVCALEVWCELFGGNKKDMKYNDAAEINAAIDQIPGWENPKKPMRFGCYGVQKGRIRGVTSGGVTS